MKRSKNKSSYYTYKIPTERHPYDNRQVQNSAGGYSYVADKFALLRRLLLLGTKYGTYYIQARDTTMAFANLVQECVNENPSATADAVREVYESGMYLDEAAVMFAIAQMCSAKDQYCRSFGIQLIRHLRTGNAMLTFCSMLDISRGWGRAIRTAIAAWYNRDIEAVAYQILKYKERSGWSHRDVLRKAHVKPVDHEHSVLFSYAADGWGDDWKYALSSDGKSHTFYGMIGSEKAIKGTRQFVTLQISNRFLDQIAAYEKMKKAESGEEIVGLIMDYRMTIEMVPSELRNDLAVWKAMLNNMPIGSLIRNLNKLTQVGAIGYRSENQKEGRESVVGRIRNLEYIQKARIHPIDLFLANRAYSIGENERFSWSPDPEIIGALDATLADLLNVPDRERDSTHKVLIAIDHSGSMDSEVVLGVDHIDAASLIATYLYSKFALADVITFSCNKMWSQIGMTRNPNENQRLVKTSKTAGGTACSDVLEYAFLLKDKGIVYDAIIIITDAETWAGQRNLQYIIANYRKDINPKMKFVNVAMAGNPYTLADPLGMQDMELCGFDSSLITSAESFISDDGVWGV